TLAPQHDVVPVGALLARAVAVQIRLRGGEPHVEHGLPALGVTKLGILSEISHEHHPIQSFGHDGFSFAYEWVGARRAGCPPGGRAPSGMRQAPPGGLTLSIASGLRRLRNVAQPAAARTWLKTIWAMVK